MYVAYYITRYMDSEFNSSFEEINLASLIKETLNETNVSVDDYKKLLQSLLITLSEKSKQPIESELQESQDLQESQQSQESVDLIDLGISENKTGSLVVGGDFIINGDVNKKLDLIKGNVDIGEDLIMKGVELPVEIPNNKHFFITGNIIMEESEELEKRDITLDDSKLFFVDNGYNLFLTFNSKFLNKIKEIYNDMDGDFEIYPSEMTLNTREYTEIISIYKDIQYYFSTFPNKEIDGLIKELEINIGEFLINLRNHHQYIDFVNKEKNKYIKKEIKPFVTTTVMSSDIRDIGLKYQAPLCTSTISNSFPLKEEEFKKKEMTMYPINNNVFTIDKDLQVQSKLMEASKKNFKELKEDKITLDNQFIDIFPSKKSGTLSSLEYPIDIPTEIKNTTVNFNNFGIELANTCNIDSFAEFINLNGDNNMSINNKYSLIYSKSYNTCVVYLNSEEYNKQYYVELANRFTDFVCYNENINDEIYKIFHKHSFDSEEEFKNYLSSIQDINFKNTYTIEESIMKYIKSNYHLSKDIKFRIKSSVLYEDVTSMLKINHPNEYLNQKLFSDYLKKLGLQRKRYSDGYYYYGIELNYAPTVENFEDLLNKLSIKRNKLQNTGNIEHISIQGVSVSKDSPINIKIDTKLNTSTINGKVTNYYNNLIIGQSTRRRQDKLETDLEAYIQTNF